MNKDKAFKLEAQEFHFGPKDEFSTLQDGQVHYGSKEELKIALQSHVAKNHFKQVVRTKHHSYTFIPKKMENSDDEYMPIRVFLAKEDTIGQFSNEDFFADLAVNCGAVNKVHNVKRLAVVTGVGALLVAGTLAFTSLAGYAINEEWKADQERLAPYIQQMEQSKREEEIKQQMLEDQRKAGEEERKELGITNEDLEQSKGLAK